MLKGKVRRDCEIRVPPRRPSQWHSAYRPPYSLPEGVGLPSVSNFYDSPSRTGGLLVFRERFSLTAANVRISLYSRLAQMGEDGGGKALHRPPRHGAIHAGEMEEQNEFIYTRLSFKRLDLIEHLLRRTGEEITQVTKAI